MACYLKIHSGIPFLVRAIMKGDGYGLYQDGEFALELETEELVIEFYDLRQEKFEPFKAQFVSRYYLGTIMEGQGGINLDGGVDDWAVDPKAMALVRQWIKRGFPEGDSAENPAVGVEFLAVTQTPDFIRDTVFVRESQHDNDIEVGYLVKCLLEESDLASNQYTLMTGKDLHKLSESFRVSPA